MAIVTISRIQHRSGYAENLPQLAKAELGWAIDSRRLYIGNGPITDGAPQAGNTEILTEYSDIIGLVKTYTFRNSDAGYRPRTGGVSNLYRATGYGLGYYYAVGNNGSLLNSSDGIIWNSVSSGTSNSIYCIAAGNVLRTVNGNPTLVNAMIAAGGFGTILITTDGQVWTPATTSLGLTLQGITFANGLWVAVSADGKAATSNDGFNWQVHSFSNPNSLLTVTYGGPAGQQKFVALGDAGTIATSSDGISWTIQTPITLTANVTFHHLEWNSSQQQFIAVSNQGLVWYSLDGITWNQREVMAIKAFAGATVGLTNYFVAVGTANYYYVSTDSINWTEYVFTGGPNKGNFFDVVWDGTQFIMCGYYGQIVTTTNPVSVTTTFQTSGTTNTLRNIAYTGSAYIIVGDSGTVLTSSNATAWTAQNSGVLSNLNSVIWDGSRYVACGDAGVILTSSDGISWTKRSTGISSNLNAMVYAAGIYVAVGNGGIILSSPDAITWTQDNSYTSVNLRSVMYNSGLGKFLAVGDDGTIAGSTNGVTWASTSGISPAGLYSINIVNTVLLAGGTYETIIDSPDSNTWTSLNGLDFINNAPPDLYGIAFGNAKWVGVGTVGNNVFSSDGIYFTTRALFTGNTLNGINWSGSQFTAVGINGELDRSTDGLAWSVQTYSSGSSVTIRTLQRKLDDTVSVKDFGAVGDGITDDTESINRAMYELYCRVDNPNAKKILFFPAGNYLLSQELRIPPYATLIGEGPYNTVITQTANPYVTNVQFVMRTADSLQQVGPQMGLNGASLPSDIIIKDMGLVSTFNGILIDKATRVTVNRARMQGPFNQPTVLVDPLAGTSSSGIELSGQYLNRPADINIVDVYTTGFQIGFNMLDSQYAEAVTIDSNTFFNLYRGIQIMPNTGGELDNLNITGTSFDKIFAEGIYAGYVVSATTYNNSFLDVGNTYLGSGNPTYNNIRWLDTSSYCIGINDRFARSDADALILARVYNNGTGGRWYPSRGLQLGYYDRTNGSSVSLYPGQATATATGILFATNDYVGNAVMQYTIRRGGFTRTGFITLSYDTNGAIAMDDSTETGDVGTTFSASLNGTQVSLDYVSSNGSGSYTMEYSTSSLRQRF